MNNMLELLRQIVQDVSGASTLESALHLIVTRIKQAMNTHVCSVYLFDRDKKEYILMATQGLSPHSVGKASLKYSEGIVGLVGSREEPVNIDDASSHPKFHYIKGTGEEKYHAFLGVPIIHHGTVLGVLVVQQRARRRFDGGEEAFLITMSAQLAGVIAHAEATGAISNLQADKAYLQQTKFQGVPGSPGVAIGHAVVLSPKVALDAIPDRKCSDVELEVSKFVSALESVRGDIKNESMRLAGKLRPEEMALFDVYLRMLDDAALGNEVIAKIRDENQWAQGALRHVITSHIRSFNSMEDRYLRERAVDIKDLGLRVLSALQSRERHRDNFPENTIIVSDEVLPSMLSEVPVEQLIGVVSVKGSQNSHVAILARAMGIPTVMGVLDLPYGQLEGKEIILDGYKGELFFNPTEKLIQSYQSIVVEEQQLVKGLEALNDEICVTSDGHRVPLMVNTGLYVDVIRSLDRGAEGVGLYRTEVPFMLQQRFPSEKEQQEIYRQQLEAFSPKPVTMRTLDIGGDKSLPYFPIEEDNPFLGWRGIRVMLDHPEFFLMQVRAMLKASEGLDNLRIMLPMISNVGEIETAQLLIFRALSEVLEEGLHVNMPEVGVMIEVPGAVYQVKEMASMVDFLSVGSNDLTQYLLAVDRNNPRVAHLYHSFHPAVLHALHQIVSDAHSVGKKVSVCGELAGDPGGATLLMAMGYDMLSMTASNLPRVKSVIRAITREWADDLLARVLRLDQAHVVRSTVDLALERIGVGRMLKPKGGN